METMATREMLCGVNLFMVGLLVVSSLTTCGAQSVNASFISAEGRLIRDVIDTWYDPRERPPRDDGGVLYVDLQFILFALFELDVRRQIVSGSAWLELIWEDDRLSWDESEYGGIRYLNIDSQKIWTPQLVLQNSAMESTEDPLAGHSSYAIILSEGTVRLTIPLRFVTFCLPDVENFPFDNQTCTVTVSSPSMPSTSFTPRNLSGTVGSITNTQWEVGLGEAYPTVISDSRIAMEYHKVHFVVTLRRKPYYFVINLVLPSSLINCMSLLAFWVPPESGEKVSTAVSLLLGVVVFQIVVIDMLPVSDGTMPLLARYIFVNFLVSCGCVLSAVITLNIYRRVKPIQSRRWRRIWFRYLARLVLVKNAIVDSEVGGACRKKKKSSPENIILRNPVEGQGDDVSNVVYMVYSSDKNGPVPTPESPRCELRAHGDAQSERVEEELSEMAVVAEIINRILFGVFLILYVAFLIYWLVTQETVSAPHVHEKAKEH